MYEKAPYFYGTGRRKSSVARVRVYQGTGKVTINDRDIDDYFGLETLKLIVRQPLVLTGTDEKFDIVCRVAGGGVTGQAGAIRHGIARALLQSDARTCAPSEEGRLPDPRPENEGAQEVRPQGRSSRASVLQEITGPTNQFKNAQKARNHAVFRAFSFPKSLLSFVRFWKDLTSPDPVFLD